MYRQLHFFLSSLTVIGTLISDILLRGLIPHSLR
jgi:hypothetical protein